MGITSENKIKTYYRLTAFILPVMTMTIAFVLLGLYPFGNRMLSVGDLQIQYVQLYGYLREMLSGKADIYYTFSKSVGGNMISILSYYLMSPFNILYIFASVSTIPVFVALVAVLKCGFMGLSLFCYLEVRHGCRIWCFIPVIAYALSGFVITYQTNSMWMDALIWLPVIASGIEGFSEDPGSFVKVAIGLIAGIAANYYTGFMLGIFICLYYTVNVIFYKKHPQGAFECRNAVMEHGKGGGRSAGCLANYVYFFVLLGATVGTMLWLLLPTLHALKGNKLDYVSFGELLSLRPFFSLREILGWMLPAWMGERAYVGILSPGIAVIILAAFSFMIRYPGDKGKGQWMADSDRGEKLGNGIMLAVLVFSMAFAGPYQIWHGAAYPAGYPIRFGFIFIFVLVKCAAAALGKAEEHFSADRRLLFRNLAVAVIVLQCVAAIANMYLEYGRYYGTGDYVSYSGTYGDIESLTEALPSKQEFYRLQWEGDFNLGWMFNIPSLSSYTSCEDGGFRAFMGKLGLPVEDHASFFELDDVSEPLLSLMSVRYIIGEKDLETPEYLHPVMDGDNYSLYEYRDYMPLGVFAAKDLGDLENGDYAKGELLKLIFDRISGTEREIFIQGASDGGPVTDEEEFRLTLKDILADTASENSNISLTVNRSSLQWELNNTSESSRDFFIALPEESRSWIIKLDGKRVPSKTAAVFFTAVDIPPGKHTLQMKYYPWWMAEGVILSCISAVILSSLLAHMGKVRHK